MIRQEAKQAERKVKPNRHLLCINIGICIGNEINRELFQRPPTKILEDMHRKPL